MSSKYSDLINEQGFLTHSDAKRFVHERFEKEIDILLGFGNTESEIKTIGSVLSNIIGSKVATKISKLK
jgi:hypothetical protein